jgi:hypothetical protein
MLRGTFGGRYGDTSGRPYLEGRLILPRLGIRGDISFLVDTGADASLLSPLDAQRLGVDFSKLEGDGETWGISGVSHNFIEEAVLVFAEPGTALYIYYIDLDIAVPDPNTPPDLPSLLGRDIIDHWRMTYSPIKKNLAFKVLEADHTVDLQAP